MKLVLICLIAFAASVAGQLVVVHDGNWWVQQSAPVKVGYVIGCMDHVSTANPDWSANVRFARTPRINDVCEGLDAFYAAPGNRATTLQMAMPGILLALSREK